MLRLIHNELANFPLIPLLFKGHIVSRAHIILFSQLKRIFYKYYYNLFFSFLRYIMRVKNRILLNKFFELLNCHDITQLRYNIMYITLAYHEI